MMDIFRPSKSVQQQALRCPFKTNDRGLILGDISHSSVMCSSQVSDMLLLVLGAEINAHAVRSTKAHFHETV